MEPNYCRKCFIWMLVKVWEKGEENNRRGGEDGQPGDSWLRLSAHLHNPYSPITNKNCLNICSQSVFTNRNFLDIRLQSVFADINFLDYFLTICIHPKEFSGYSLAKQSVFTNRNFLDICSQSVFTNRNFLDIRSQSVFTKRNFLDIHLQSIFPNWTFLDIHLQSVFTNTYQNWDFAVFNKCKYI